MRCIFVAGTDTGIGKTIVAASLAAAMCSKNLRVAVMKPVSCGGLEDAHFLAKAIKLDEPLDKICPIQLKHPLSPNVAAHLEKTKIDLTRIDKAIKYFEKKYDYLVVEGCGGLLVPITDKFFVIDLIQRVKASTILVSRSGLGAINHTLLSLEALRARKIKPIGVVFNRLSSGPLSIPEKTNPKVIEKASNAQSLGTFPYIKQCSGNCLGKAFLKHIDLKKILC